MSLMTLCSRSSQRSNFYLLKRCNDGVRVISLHPGSDSYAEIDPNCTQSFELSIPQFTSHDVLCIAVACLADIPRNSSDRSIFNQRPSSHQALSIELSNDATHSTFTPASFNGEYEFTLTSSHGFAKGAYTLRVTNTGNMAQSIRVNFKLLPYIQATSITTSTTLTSTCDANAYTYFRLRAKNPEQLISIRAEPKEGAGGDPDLFISNHFNGYVAVDSANAVWRSAQSGGCQVEIHPKDEQRARGDVYIIGVRGYNDATTFTLSVSASLPDTILQVTPPYSTTLTLSANASYFHYLHVDSTRKGKVSHINTRVS